MTLSKRFIDSRAFQRLRRISQLGPTNLVYPTANHTRLEHSLGTLQSSDELLRELLDRSPGIDVLDWNRQEKLEARTLLRLASLLYGVGHAPFSHAAEDLFPEELKHEDYTYKIIVESELGDIVDRHMGRDARMRVAEISIGQAKSSKDIFLSQLLTGNWGTDRMEYLKRDSHHLGVAYGQFDRSRLITTLSIRENPDNGGSELILEKGGLYAVEVSCWPGISCSSMCTFTRRGESWTYISRNFSEHGLMTESCHLA